jgi:integrase/recombinase XerD
VWRIPNCPCCTTASQSTDRCYRDTFRLLLQFAHPETGIEPAVLAVAGLDAEIILRFLDALERDRGNAVASRNLRLTVVRSFYRMVALRDPVSIGVATRVLAMSLKRTNTRVREFLTREEMEAILASIDRTHWCGRRDYALLLTVYNSGARVSEISGLRQSHISFGCKSYVQLNGKGRKDRSIPLWPRTARVLKDLFREVGQPEQAMAFPSIRGEPLTRFAIHLLLRKAVERTSCCSTLKKKRVSPHVGSAQHSDGFASVRCRHCRHRAMAGTRKHRNYECVFARRSRHEGKSVSKSPAGGHAIYWAAQAADMPAMTLVVKTVATPVLFARVRAPVIDRCNRVRFLR